MGLLVLAIAGCGSSDKAATDSGTDVATTDAHSDTPATDIRPDTPTDKGNDLPVDRAPADVAQSICTGVVPTHQVIADFEGMDNSAFGSFGQDPLTGNTYVNSVGVDPGDFTNKTWHLSGTVYGRQDFFGLSWSCIAAPSGGCTMDASQWAGIQFTIKGNAGPSRKINFTLGRADNDTPAENAMCGTCAVPTDAASSEAACHGPRVSVPLPTDPTMVKTVTLYWTDFAGGSPKASADPHQLTGMLWYFDDPPPTDGGASPADAGADGGATDRPPPGAASYSADITIDDVQFIPFP